MNNLVLIFLFEGSGHGGTVLGESLKCDADLYDGCQVSIVCSPARFEGEMGHSMSGQVSLHEVHQGRYIFIVKRQLENIKHLNGFVAAGRAVGVVFDDLEHGVDEVSPQHDANVLDGVELRILRDALELLSDQLKGPQASHAKLAVVGATLVLGVICCIGDA